MACDSSRFDVIIEKNIPLVLSVGALDMVNFGPKDSIPSNFQQRKIHVHNAQVISPYTSGFFSLPFGAVRLSIWQRNDYNILSYFYFWNQMVNWVLFIVFSEIMYQINLFSVSLLYKMERQVNYSGLYYVCCCLMCLLCINDG